MLEPEVIEEELSVLEEKVFQLDIITSFEFRGWGLYKCDVEHVDNLEELKTIISMGREKNKLEYGTRYIPLPLSENDSSYESVKKLIDEMIFMGRGPYFVEFIEGEDDNGKWVQPVGRFLVESVALEPPNLVLIIDRRLSNVLLPEFYNGEAIEIPLYELHKIRKQLMLSLR